MEFFSIQNIAFELLGYNVSYIELVGTLFGLISVILASKVNILTWPTGIVNELALFLLFFQVQLYSDMLLQVFFFFVTIYGWYFWKKKSKPQIVNRLKKKTLLIYIGVLFLGTIVLGLIISEIHIIFPKVFSKPASFPFFDAFTTVASIIGTILLSRKVLETWLFWISVDIVSVFLYIRKDIYLMSIEYFIFLVICIVGYMNWKKLVI